MYTNFTFEKRNNEIIGYSFPCDTPSHVMCIVHGIGEYAGRYKRLAGFLNEAGVAVLSMDLRGHGKSAGKRGHAAPRSEVIKDVDALISYAEEMYPNVPITLYGHSMGGNIVLDYLMRGGKNQAPKSYVVSAPWVEITGNVPKALHVAMKGLVKIAPKIAIKSGCDESKLGNLDYVRPYSSDKMNHNQITVQCALECYEIGMAIEHGRNPNNHGADNTPLLLMHGSSDMICSVVATRNVAKLFKDRPDFEYKEWEGYYHEIHNGGPHSTGEEAINKIKEFVLSH